MKKLFIKFRPHYNSNLQLAIPVVISQLGHTLVHTADSIIVGHFAGTVQLAAVSLVNSLFIILMLLGIGISYGLTPLIAQENGKKAYSECGKLLANGLVINTITGIVLYITIYFGLLLFIDDLDQTPEVVAYAKPYLKYLGISIIPLMVYSTFKQFAEGLGFTKQAMMITILGNILNVCLGIVFVKGMFGIAPMGVKGVGLSTLIDRILMAIAMGSFVFRSERFTTYLKGFSLNSINKFLSTRILKIGAPVSLQYAFEATAFSGAAIIIGTIGAVPQAAHQVAIAMASITYMMASGISAAATIKTGNNYGSKDFYQLRLSALSNYHIVMAFMMLMAIIFIIFNQYLPFVYTKDQAVIAVASQLLIIAGFFQLFDGAQVVGLGILRGMGDVNIPTIITFLAYAVVGLPVGYYLGIIWGMGVNGIWFGLTLGLLISGALLFIRFQIISKKLMNDTIKPTLLNT